MAETAAPQNSRSGVMAVVVAAGSGTRAGGEPKQYRTIGGETVLTRTLRPGLFC